MGERGTDGGEISFGFPGPNCVPCGDVGGGKITLGAGTTGGIVLLLDEL